MTSFRSPAHRRAWSRAPAIAAAIALAVAVGPVSAASLSPERTERLDHLLRHDCGSCHGMTMKGGLGPALLPDRLADRDEDGLVDMILYGNPERAMPPWRDLLGEDEARWIVRRLKRGLGEEGSKR